jgi:hypothetical protein
METSTRYLAAVSSGGACVVGSVVGLMVGVGAGTAVGVGVTARVGVDVGVGVSVGVQEPTARLSTIRQLNINQTIPFFIHLFALSDLLGWSSPIRHALLPRAGICAYKLLVGKAGARQFVV